MAAIGDSLTTGKQKKSAEFDIKVVAAQLKDSISPFSGLTVDVFVPERMVIVDEQVFDIVAERNRIEPTVVNVVSNKVVLVAQSDIL